MVVRRGNAETEAGSQGSDLAPFPLGRQGGNPVASRNPGTVSCQLVIPCMEHCMMPTRLGTFLAQRAPQPPGDQVHVTDAWNLLSPASVCSG